MIRSFYILHNNGIDSGVSTRKFVEKRLNKFCIAHFNISCTVIKNDVR